MILPPVLAGACLLAGSPRQILILVSAGGAGWACLAGVTAWAAFVSGPFSTARGWLYLDALSAYHAIVLGLVLGASSVYAWGYFGGELSLRAARRFGALWFGSAAAMTLVLLSNNLGVMWVGIEATTLLTAFLICVHVTPLSLEAMWKYLVVCSVGVAFAFVGTLLVGASAQRLGLDASEMLLWTRLRQSAAGLAPGSMKLAFFSVGRLGQMYGTHDLGRMAGAMRRAPLWGVGFFGGVLVLIGVAPFAIFMSEFQILRAAVDAQAFVALALFLLGAGIVFVGALRHAMTPAWGEEVCEPTPQRSGIADAVLVWGALGLLLVLGLWMPGPLKTALDAAALVVRGHP